MESERDVVELLPGSLYALGGLIELDGRVAWAPSRVRGHQPVNCYLALEDAQATVIDTGVAMHRDLIVGQLEDFHPQARPVVIALTRAEYETMGNLGEVIRRLPVADLYTGGTNNPFDGPDDPSSPRGRWDRLVKLRTITLDEALRVGQSSRLEVWSAPIRVLPTHWLHDSAAGCLFTSDLFGHTVLEDPSQPRVIDSVSSAWQSSAALAVVKEYIAAKFAWLEAAESADSVIEDLDAVFERRDVRIVAPAHGCILVGREVVQHHYQLVRTALAEIAGRSRLVSKPGGLTASAHFPARATSVTIPAAAAPSESSRPGKLPREIAPNIFWLGTCISRFTFDIAGERFHGHLSSFLVRGSEQCIFIDTGLPSTWDEIEAQLDEALAGRPLDWIFPTHAEPPHSFSVGKLLAKFPDSKLIGDTRDFHLFFPGSESRLVPVAAGDTVDLGGGYVLEFVPAFLKDLPGTLWAYERKQGVLFVADGFGLGHRQPAATEEESELPVHRSGECTLMLSELRSPLHIDQAYHTTVGALHWTRFVDSGPIFDELQMFLAEHPTRFLAPAHGYVIDGAEVIQAALPLIREAHDRAFEDGPVASRKPVA